LQTAIIFIFGSQGRSPHQIFFAAQIIAFHCPQNLFSTGMGGFCPFSLGGIIGRRAWRKCKMFCSRQNNPERQFNCIYDIA